MSENNQKEYQEMGIDILIGNKDKSLIHERIKEFINKRKSITAEKNKLNYIDDQIVDGYNKELEKVGLKFNLKKN